MCPGKVQITLAGLAPWLLAAALLAGCGGDAAKEPQTVQGKSLGEWEKQLAEEDPELKVAALEALASFEDPPLDEVSALLEHENARVRAAAISALGAFGPGAAKWAPELAAYLEEDPKGFDAQQSRDIRNAAILTLGKIGIASWKHLGHMLVSRDSTHRLRVVFTIRPFASEIEGLSKALTPLMHDKDKFVRREAALTLGEVGPDDDYAAEALMDGLEDTEDAVQRASALSLGKVGGSADIEGRALADKLTAYSAGVRAAAVYSLGLMGEEASPFLKAIGDLMKNDNKRVVRIEAARAFWRIGGEAGPALDVLMKDARCQDPAMCRNALRAMGELGPEAAPSIPLLLQMLEQPPLRGLAVVVLGEIGGEAKAALPRLNAIAEEVGSDDPALAEEVAKAVAAIEAGG